VCSTVATGVYGTGAVRSYPTTQHYTLLSALYCTPSYCFTTPGKQYIAKPLLLLLPRSHTCRQSTTATLTHSSALTHANRTHAQPQCGARAGRSAIATPPCTHTAHTVCSHVCSSRVRVWACPAPNTSADVVTCILHRLHARDNELPRRLLQTWLGSTHIRAELGSERRMRIWIGYTRQDFGVTAFQVWVGATHTLSIAPGSGPVARRPAACSTQC
jgi:hypothetical protein